MKVILLDGAVLNAGDFLIVERTKKILEHLIPNVKVEKLFRNVNLDDKLDLLNSADFIVYGGGPVYTPNEYPEGTPFVSNLSDVKTRCIILGGGIMDSFRHKNRFFKSNYFTNETVDFLHKFNMDDIPLCTRGWYEYSLLKNNGFSNVLMTGCPAWYDLNHINTTKLKKTSLSGEVNICVSEPAFVENFVYFTALLQFLRKQFPQAVIKVVNHREIKNEMKIIMENRFLENLGIEFVDISNSFEGLSVYDNCDLHIGFRVHAHIYNLSMRNISILLNEDLRGESINNALRLTQFSLKTGSRLDVLNIERRCGLNKLMTDIKNYIDRQNETGFFEYEIAYNIMKQTFENMKKAVSFIN